MKIEPRAWQDSGGRFPSAQRDCSGWAVFQPGYGLPVYRMTRPQISPCCFSAARDGALVTNYPPRVAPLKNKKKKGGCPMPAPWFSSWRDIGGPQPSGKLFSSKEHQKTRFFGLGNQFFPSLNAKNRSINPKNPLISAK